MKAGFRDIPQGKLMEEEKRVFDKVLGSEGPETVPGIRDEVRRIMNEKAWIYRRGDQLESGLKEMRNLKEKLKRIRVNDKGRPFNTGMLNAFELDYMLDLADVTRDNAAP